MKATIFRSVSEGYRIEDVQSLPPGPLDVVVKISASGVCGSDRHVLSGHLPLPTPLILGHEGCGVVESVGAGVRRVKVGDRVVTSADPACGTCWYCQRGQTTLCEIMGQVVMAPRAHLSDRGTAFAMVGLGTLAEYATVNEASVIPVVSDLPDEQLALIGCGVTTGFGAVIRRARVEPGSRVAIIGCGGVGLAACQAASVAGATEIIAIDPVVMKLEAARRMGATATSSGDRLEVLGFIRDRTGGRGVDYAFEVVGKPATMTMAIEATRPGGTTVLVGYPAPGDVLELDVLAFCNGEKKLMSTRFGSGDIRRDFQLIADLAGAGRLDLGALVSKRVPLDDASLQSAFAELDAGNVIRSVVIPG